MTKREKEILAWLKRRLAQRKGTARAFTYGYRQQIAADELRECREIYEGVQRRLGVKP